MALGCMTLRRILRLKVELMVFLVTGFKRCGFRL